MYYIGEFRSLDQSVDPRGQLYKVLIFTGYDSTALNPTNLFRSGTVTNVGPYPTEEVMAGWAQEAGTGTWVMLHANVPQSPEVLTMTDHPVTIGYVGDGKLQKPYRCSTASISFLQSTLNANFINSLGQRVLVYVLKWKNEVVLTNANTYKNTITNETLSKTVKQYYDSWSETYVKYYNDFIPWEKDNFCYDVVWAGFSTPEMLNTAFDHIVDKFTLNCQDALSTLKYTRFTRTGQMESMLDSIMRGLLTLGIYRKLYITNNVHFAGALNDFETSIPATGTALRWMGYQQDNLFNEDGEAMYFLDVYENMMKYLGLTMIPEGDSLYITNDHCIGNGHTDYTEYTLVTGDFLWAIPALNPSYNIIGNVNIANTIRLNGDRFCSSSTSLSSDVMVNKVSVECDEMRPDPLLPDLDDDGNYKPEIPSQNQPLALNLWDRYVTSTPGQYDEENYHYLEMYLNGLADGIDNIKFYCYPGCGSSWSGTPHDPDVNDFVVTHARRYAGQSAENPAPDWVYGIIVPPPSDYQSAGTPGVMSCMIDYADTSVSSRTQVPTSFNLKRGILIATPGNQSFSRYNGPGTANPHDWDDKSTYWCPTLYLKSKPFLGNGKQYLNINGTFTYYGMGTINPTNWYPGRMANRTSSYFSFSTNKNYIWTKVKMGNYYLANVTSTGRGQYEWVDYETFVRLWFDDAGMSSGADYRWTGFNMETNIRGVNGITVELPVIDGYAVPMQIEIWFDRPLGPGENSSFCPHSTVISDLAVNIYSDEYVQSRKRRNPDRDNTRYENEVVSGAVEEGDTVDLIFSSTDTAGLSYAETTFRTVRRRTAGVIVNRANPKVFNDGSGYYGLPEQVRIDTDRHQGITPSIKIDTGIFLNDMGIHSRFLWESQLPGHKFIVDSAEIDLEYEQCDITLLEVKAADASTTQVNRMNATRNYHRTRDIMFDGHVALRNPVAIGIPVIGINSIEYDEPSVILDTTQQSTGSSTFNMDWDTGQFRLTTPIGVNLTAARVDNQVVVTTE